MIKREKILEKINKKLDNKNKILFLIWARQVWKTTLLKSLIEFWYLNKDEWIFLFWDELADLWVNNFQGFIENIQIKRDLKSLKYLILDEAQYIPNIWLILKILIDKVRNWEFDFKIIVSWSWSLNIFSWITDSLIWRKDIISISWFSFEEFLETKWIKLIQTNSESTIKQYLSYFNEYILFWWYPDVVLAKNETEKFEIFKSIFEDYIHKDVQLLLENKDLIKFKQFVKLIASKIWTHINISKLSEDLWVSKYILEKYLFVIENTFLLQKVEPWHWWKFKNEIKKQYKIYFKDIWMLRYLLWMSEWIWDFKWKVVENFVCNEIFYKKENFEEIFFWWTTDWWEVDFILENQTNFKITPIEVKSWNKLNIPKSYSWFIDRYWDKIEKWIITTELKNEKKWNISFVSYVSFII